MMSELFSAGSLWALLLWQGTACIAAGLGASFLWRRWAARAHQALLVGMAAAVLAPALSLAVKHFELGLLVAETTAPEAAAPSEEHFDLAVFRDLLAAELPAIETTMERRTPDVAETIPAAPPAGEPAAAVPWNAVLFGGWIVAAALLLGRLLLRFLLGRRILRRAVATHSERLHRAVEIAKAKVGIDRQVQLESSERIRSPIIWCWSRTPVLLVQKHAEDPAAGTDWVGVFCHELAHWKRRDHVSGLFGQLLTVALPWHPLLWWARKRLLRLSEEACDDWAVYGVPAAVQYAESLLDLSPESQLAFLPTVVGKEKVMKARISRIVTDRCANPRIGTRWAMVAGLLTVLATVAVAFAQRRPDRSEPPQMRERQDVRERQQDERHELAIAGRRNVLQRMLDQLVAQSRQTEAALRQGGDALGEQGHLLRSELDALHEHIEMVERQLHNLDRDSQRAEPQEDITWRLDDGKWIPAPPEARGEPPEARMRRERSEEIEKALDLLRQERARAADEAHQKEMELNRRRQQAEGPGEAGAERTQQLEEELEQIRMHARTLETQMAEIERQRAEIDLENAMQAVERARLEGEKAESVRQKLMEEALAEHRKTVEEKERRRHLLEQRLKEITERAEQLQRKLEAVGDKDAEQARILQETLQFAREDMASVEGQLRDVERERASFERDREGPYGEAPRRSRGRVSGTGRRGTSRYADEMMHGMYGDDDPTARGRSRSRRDSRDEDLYDEMDRMPSPEEQRDIDLQRSRLVRALEGLLEQARYTEEELRGAQGTDDDKADALRRVLEQLQERRASLEHELDQYGPEWPEAGPGARRDRPEDEDQPMVKFYRLKHINAGQMLRILQPLAGRPGKVIAVERTNSLLVEDTAAGHARIEGVIAALDVPGASPQRPRPEEGVGIETEVEELRGKVDGLHEQMQQMREMLQQIMEQTQKTPPLYEIETPEGP